MRYAKLGELLHRRNEARIEAIRRAAQTEAQELLVDPGWVAGVVAYWAEGAKRNRELVFANSDMAMVKLFITWSMKYLGVKPDDLTIRLHLHTGQDENKLRLLWSERLGIGLDQFRKGFMKPEGTGHRKNVLYGGTARVRVCKSSDLLHKVLEWIDVSKRLINNV